MSPETETIPIVLCSAATDQVREQEGWLTAKGVKVVAKPFTVDDLELAISKALSLPGILYTGADGATHTRRARARSNRDANTLH